MKYHHTGAQLVGYFKEKSFLGCKRSPGHSSVQKRKVVVAVAQWVDWFADPCVEVPLSKTSNASHPPVSRPSPRMASVCCHRRVCVNNKCFGIKFSVHSDYIKSMNLMEILPSKIQIYLNFYRWIWHWVLYADSVSLCHPYATLRYEGCQGRMPYYTISE